MLGFRRPARSVSLINSVPDPTPVRWRKGGVDRLGASAAPNPQRKTDRVDPEFMSAHHGRAQPHKSDQEYTTDERPAADRVSLSEAVIVGR